MPATPPRDDSGETPATSGGGSSRADAGRWVAPNGRKSQIDIPTYRSSLEVAGTDVMEREGVSMPKVLMTRSRVNGALLFYTLVVAGLFISAGGRAARMKRVVSTVEIGDVEEQIKRKKARWVQLSTRVVSVGRNTFN